MLIYIVFLSIVIQLITAILALRLIRITGKQYSWVFIAVAMLLMAARRILTLSGIISGEVIFSQVATSEWIGLLISALMLAGVTGFDKILNRIERVAKDWERTAENNLAQAALLNSAHDAIFVRSVDDQIIYWNKGAERKYGWNFEEVSSKIAHDQLKTEFPIPLSIIKAQVAEKGVWEGELTHTRKDGNKIVVNSRWVAHMDQKGLFSGILEINRDITSQKQIEKKLRLLNERISTATRSAQVGIWERDIVNNRLEWDDQMYALYAINKVDFPKAYEAWLNGLHPEDREATNRIVQQAISGEREYDTEFRIVWPDGTVRWIKAAGQVFYDENNIPLKMVGINFDITERKKAEEQLRISEERYRNIFESAVIGLYRSTPDGKIILANSTLIKLLGFDSFEDLAQRNLENEGFEDSQLRNRFQEIIEKEGSVIGLESIWKKKNGQPVIVNENAKVFYDNNGKVMYYEGTVEDITDRKKMEKTLRESEEKFRKAFSINPDAITITRLSDGKYISANNGFNQIFGYAPEEIIGKTSLELNIWHNPEDRKEFVRQMNENGFVQNFEAKLTTKPGEVKYTLVSASIIDLENTPVILSTTRDITERKHMEESLRESEERLRDIIFSSADWIWEVDENGRYTYSSQRGTELFDTNQEEILGKTPFDFMPEEEAIKIASLFSEIVSRKAPITDLENWNIGKEGKRICLLTNGLPIIDHEGLLKGYRGVDKDITERKLAEEELINAKEKAEESDRLKSAFLANMSHEIRTPLNSIIGFSDLLFDPFFSTEQQKEFVKSIKNSGDNLLVIISDIMDLSKIESGQFQITKRPFSINNLIIDIQKEYSYKATEKEIELKVDLPAKDDIYIDSDLAKVRQILINLVTNAIKFTENGSIEIGFKVIDHTIQIQVKDNGIGIPSEYHQIIFERFRQVENSQTRRFGGNGLGLAISKNLVKMLGGKIWLESEVGKGSTFYFGLPMK